MNYDEVDFDNDIANNNGDVTEYRAPDNTNPPQLQLLLTQPSNVNENNERNAHTDNNHETKNKTNTGVVDSNDERDENTIQYNQKGKLYDEQVEAIDGNNRVDDDEEKTKEATDEMADGENKMNFNIDNDIGNYGHISIITTTTTHLQNQGACGNKR